MTDPTWLQKHAEKQGAVKEAEVHRAVVEIDPEFPVIQLSNLRTLDFHDRLHLFSTLPLYVIRAFPLTIPECCAHIEHYGKLSPEGQAKEDSYRDELREATDAKIAMLSQCDEEIKVIYEQKWWCNQLTKMEKASEWIQEVLDIEEMANELSKKVGKCCL